MKNTLALTAAAVAALIATGIPQAKATVLCAAMALTAAFLVAPSAASAAEITYVLSPSVMFNPPGGGTDTITGTFMFDPSGPTLKSVDLTVTGPLNPGTYDVPGGALADTIVADSATAFFTLFFQNKLGNAPDNVTF
jgi:hypothetical protein